MQNLLWLHELFTVSKFSTVKKFKQNSKFISLADILAPSLADAMAWFRRVTTPNRNEKTADPDESPGNSVDSTASNRHPTMCQNAIEII